MQNLSSKSGFTLIEMMVYVGIMAIVVTALVIFTSDSIKVNNKCLMLRVSLDNAERAVEIIAKEIKHARNFYTPTSVFDTSPGQLSLKTIKNLPEGEKETYVDFYIEDEKLYIKREGTISEALTSNEVRVTNLVFRNLGSSIQIDLTVDYKSFSSRSAYQASTSLTTSATLRQ